MTVLFVLATLVLFLTVDYFVQRSRTRKAALEVAEQLAALGRAFQPLPQGVRLQANHTWSKDDPHGVVTIGLDEFLAKFLGAVESIVLPPSGTLVGSSAQQIRLEDGGRELALALPVAGKVVSVNPDVLRSPALAASDPYGHGWLMKVQAEQGMEGYGVEHVGAQAMQWLREQAEAAREFFGAHEPHGAMALLQDGGEPVAGLLKEYDGNAWREFQQHFLELHSGAEEQASTRSN